MKPIPFTALLFITALLAPAPILAQDEAPAADKCDQCEKCDDCASAPLELENTHWKLVSASDSQGAFDLTPAAEQPLTLAFLAMDEAAEDDDDVLLRAAGHSGVNRFNSQVELEDLNDADSEIDFGAIASTRMAGPQPLMQLEQRYLAALDAAENIALDENGRLVLCSEADDDDDSAVELIFAPTEAPE